MEAERYVGERRALRHSCRNCGRWSSRRSGADAVLRYRSTGARIGRSGGPAQAREIFHNQPEDLKRRLMRGIFEAPAARPSKSHLLERYTQREPEPFVRFDAYPAATSEDVGLSVELDHELCDDVPGAGAGQPRHAAGQRRPGAAPDRRLDRARPPAAVGAPLAGRGPAAGAEAAGGRRRTQRAIRATVPIRPDPPPASPAPAAGRRHGAARLCSRQLAAGGLRPGADPDRGPGEDARRALAEGRSAALIRTVVVGNPFGMDEARRDALVTAAMAEGVAGLDVRFTTSPTRRRRPSRIWSWSSTRRPTCPRPPLPRPETLRTRRPRRA